MAQSIKGVPLNHVGNYTVATLPASSVTGITNGVTAFANDCLKGSETTGNGTGNMVFFQGGTWYRVDTGTAAGT